MKKTYEQISEFFAASNDYIKRVKGDNPEAKGNKLTYALERVQKNLVKKCRKKEQQRQIKTEDAAVNYASVYPADYEQAHLRGQLIVINGNYSYTPPAEIERRAAIREAHDELMASEIEFDPYYATDVPPDLTEEEREMFEDFVLRPQPEPMPETTEDASPCPL